MLTVIIKQQDEELSPSVPFKPSVRLSQQLAGVNKRTVFIQKVHVLPKTFRSQDTTPQAVNFSSKKNTYNRLAELELQIRIVTPQLNFLFR